MTNFLWVIIIHHMLTYQTNLIPDGAVDLTIKGTLDDDK